MSGEFGNKARLPANRRKLDCQRWEHLRFSAPKNPPVAQNHADRTEFALYIVSWIAKSMNGTTNLAMSLCYLERSYCESSARKA